ncbi:MAG: hypothetical protein ACLTXI_13575 [Collinsella sp.]
MVEATTPGLLYWDHAGKGFEKDFGKGHYIYLYDALSGGNGEHSDGADKSEAEWSDVCKSLNAVYERLTDDIAGYRSQAEGLRFS